MATYMQWNDALCDWFFRPDLADQDVYLSCDSSVPATVAQAQGWLLADPLEDMLSAVRARTGAREPLDPWVREAVAWRRAGSDGNPPWVAVLAVTVLAAAGGGHTEGVPVLHERAYYRPLRRLLGLPEGSRPHGFDNDVRMLWKYLREWLEDDLSGARGRCTASPTEHLPNVGWALSQTLLGSAERAQLPEFFQAIGARPAEEIPADVLLACYLRWAVRHHGHRDRLATLDRGSPAAGMLAGVLHQSLLTWDGCSRDERGRATLPLLLAYDHSRAVLRLVSRVPVGLDHRSLVIEGQTVLLGAPQEYLLLPSDPAKTLAGHTISGRLVVDGPAGCAEGTALQMKLPAVDVHVLAFNVELGMSVEVGATSFGQEHVVIVRESVAPAAEKAIADLGGDVVRLTRLRVPSGWCAYRLFEPARLAEVPGNLTPLLPGVAELAHLGGGLPIDLRSRIWLTGAPPDVVLPDLEDLREQAVRLNGEDLPWPTTGRLRLYEHGLVAGAHELSVAGRVLRFTLVDEAVDQDGRGDVRLTVDRRPIRHSFTPSLAAPTGADTSGGADSRVVQVQIAVCGACVTAAGEDDRLLAPPPRRQIRVGGCYYVLGVPGQAARLHPVVPAWLSRLNPPLYSRDTDLESALSGLSFPARWLLHIPVCGQHRVTRLDHVTADPGANIGKPPDAGPAVWQRVAEHLDLVQAPAAEQASWQAWLDRARQLATPDTSLPPPPTCRG
jgi:hypothetical protein